MKSAPTIKPLIWVGGSKKGLLEIAGGGAGRFRFCTSPGPDRQEARSGEADEGLWLGRRPGDRGGLRGDTYRAVYSVKFGASIYVLHCFQKKSTKGIATPKPDLEKIQTRLKAAEAHSKGMVP